MGKMKNQQIVLIRGGGDLASGIALRLHRVGMRVVITELAQPLVIRRSVAFAEAVYNGVAQVEDVKGRFVGSFNQVVKAWKDREVPVLVDPESVIIKEIELAGLELTALVDGRMTKRPPYLKSGAAPFMIGLGPGFIVGENCDVIVETNRGHYLGRLIWQGTAQPNTGRPEGFGNQYHDRVLRSPANGIWQSARRICESLKEGEAIGEVNGIAVVAPFDGVIRGLLHPGLYVTQGFKIGDIDPRNDPQYCRYVSDKALAVAGGVLEAILICESMADNG